MEGGSGIVDSSSYMEKRRNPNQVKSKWTHHQLSAFLITFFGYAMFHATRKTFSNVKGTMSAEWSPFNNGCCPAIYDKETWNSRHLFKSDDNARLYLGTLDTVFMIAYALGLYISGALGDRFDLRKVLAIGMWASSISVFLFGTLTEWLGFRDYYLYIVLWMLTGLLQSSGWPTVVAIIGNWFGKSSRGLVMGLWGASPSVGNIIGSYTVSGVILYGYEYAFLVPASMMFAFGIIIFFGVVSSPKDVGLPDPCEEERKQAFLQDVQAAYMDTDELVSAEDPPSEKAISFFQAFLLPGVLPYSIAYACLKLVNYSFFFWLPYYLESKYKWTEADADSLSTWYDVGGIVGSVIGGIVSDKLGTRSPIVGVLLILGPPSLFIYNASPADKVVNAILMSICGFFIGGAANLISTTVAADLGKQKEFSGNKESLATVTGIIDGTGSVGAALGQLIIPLLSKEWSYVFYLFMVMTFLTFLCILKIIIHDLKELWLKRRRCATRSFVGSSQSEDCDPLLGCG